MAWMAAWELIGLSYDTKPKIIFGYLKPKISNKEKRTETLGQVRLLVDKDFGRQNVAKGRKGLAQVRVPKFLWQVIDEQVGTFRPFLLSQSVDDAAT